MKHFFMLVLSFCLVGIVYATDEDYPPISPENVMNLQEVETIGQGTMNLAVTWMPDGRIVTGGVRGIFIFADMNAEAEFIDMGKPVSISRFVPDNNTVFAYFDGKINTFDLTTRTIRYQLDGGTVLAISENKQLVAYTGYRSILIAELVTGELRFMLDYSGMWSPDYNDAYGYRMSNFVFAQFINGDEQMLVRWAIEEGQEEFPYGGYFSSSDIWTLGDGTFETLKDDANAQRSEDEFVAYDSIGQAFRLNEGTWHRDDLSINLFPSDISLRLKTDAYNYWLDGDLFAAPVGAHSESETYYGIDAIQTGIWNIQTGEFLVIIPSLGRVQFSPDQTKLAIANEIFDLSTGEQLATLQNDVYQVLSGVSDRILRYAADDSLRLLDAMTMQEIAILPMKRNELAEIREFFSDGSFLLVHQNHELLIRISGTTGEEIARFEVEQSFAGLQLTEDERYFFREYWSANYVLDGVWDASTGERIEFPDDFIPLIRNLEANQVIGWTGESIGFYDLNLGQYRKEISLAGTGFENRGEVNALRMSNDGQYLVISFNREGFVMRISTGEIVTRFTGNADFSPSSTLLAYSDAEFNIWIMNLADGQIIQTWYVAPITPSFGGVYFQSDEILSVNLPGPDGGGETRRYNIFTGQELYTIFPPQQTPVPEPFAVINGLRFFNDYGIRIEWNENPISINLRSPNFSSASLSSDGTRLFINYNDGTVGIWAVPN